jgi:hypothetical protein
VDLAWSDDGIRWQRHPERPRFMTRGPRGDLDASMVIPCQEPTIAGDQMYVYYAGYPNPHDCPSAGTGAGFRTRMRLDGFCSLVADRLPGALVTRPFTLQSNAITINAATYTGEILAELVEPWWYDPSGKPIEGFAAKDCDVFREDRVAHTLSWRGKSGLSSLIGRRLMLRMSMCHAELYSITL